MADDKAEDIYSEQASSPHEAIFFVLAYLPLYELLTMTKVSKSLKDAINNDILIWHEIVINPPLSRRVTDDILIKVVSKAKGKLRALVMINCAFVTDDSLFRVASQNPDIFKLHVPGCSGLSPAGVIRAVSVLNKNLKTIQINGIYGLQKEHLMNLQSYINTFQQYPNKIFYHEYRKCSSTQLGYETIDRSIDVEICPNCDQVRMVFSCPAQASVCKKKQQKGVNYECRGCEMCIRRCVECGMCTADDEEAEEALCGDALCLHCWLQLPKCNFCNKPYCNQHVRDQQHALPGSSGFVCSACHSKYVLYV